RRLGTTKVGPSASIQWILARHSRTHAHIGWFLTYRPTGSESTALRRRIRCAWYAAWPDQDDSAGQGSLEQAERCCGEPDRQLLREFAPRLRHRRTWRGSHGDRRCWNC